MDNIITAMLLLALTIKSSNKELLVIVATGCILSEAMFQFVDDVVLYYSIMTVITASLAFKALHSSQGVCSCIYAILMLTMGVLCISLVLSFSPTLNAVIEAALDNTSNYILSITAILAIIGTDNIFTRKYYESKY